MINDGILYHHGVKGQRWGVRRYQNYDGSLTNRGMRQYNYNTNDSDSKNSNRNYNNHSGGNRNTKNKFNNTKSAENIMKGTNQVHSSASNIVNSIIDTRQKNRSLTIDLSEMSNRDLSKAVQRLNLEQSYRNMTQTATKGETRIKKILQYSGNTLNLAGGALGIAIGLSKLGVI